MCQKKVGEKKKYASPGVEWRKSGQSKQIRRIRLASAVLGSWDIGLIGPK